MIFSAPRERATGGFDVVSPADKIEANLDEGVLTVRVPKSETNKPRRITINA